MRVIESKPLPADYEKMVGYVDKKVDLCIHAKSFVVDEKSAWIESLKVDPRSYNLNTAVALIIDDKDVAKAVKDNIMIDISPPNSWTVGRRNTVPLISHASGLWSRLMKYIPATKVWPFCYTDNFGLKAGKTVVPFYDDRFYDHYDSAGPYPGMKHTM